jgi:pyruvate,water dikinase
MALFKGFSLNKYLGKRRGKEPSLRERFRFFQTLLQANNEALEIMGDMEEKHRGEYLLDRQYIRTGYNQIRENIMRMIEALNQMCPGRYGSLHTAFERIDQGIQELVFGKREIPFSPLTIPLAEITQAMAEKVGGKMANLGEMRNRLGVPVPEGFAITAYAYKMYMEEKVLDPETKRELAAVEPDDEGSLSRIGRRIQGAIRSNPLPPDLERAILASYESLAARLNGEAPVSVRSSAVREDSEISFAGQYVTVLNVARNSILQAYQEVLASKFTPRAISYWKEKGFEEEDIPMAVGCLAMIPAKISGVMYSQDPNNIDRNSVILSAVQGLGEYAVGGQVSPDVFVVSKESGRVLERKVSRQEVMLVGRESGGITEVPVPPELREQPCLGEEEIRKLFQYAQKLEQYYQKPQDMEWAIDPAGKVYLLQTRPLRISPRRRALKESLHPDLYLGRVLIDWGDVAAPGIAAGPAFLVKGEKDLAQFPPGSVLVARQTSPKYIAFMKYAAAIITDIGNVTGHMASLAREFQVPTIVDTRVATQMIKAGQVVTVDALQNRVYDGVVEELIQEERRKEEEILRRRPFLRKLEEALSGIVPLNLVDPKADSFRPEKCQTFHDMTRYMHEMSIQEMFSFNEMEKFPRQGEAQKLLSDIPINLYLVDLGDGLVASAREKKTIQIGDIQSWPMKAIWKGLTHPGVHWTGMVNVDLKGFASVMLNTLSDSARYGETMGERSYALVSKEYVNFSSRLAYHFSTVVAYCSPVKNNNYITFHFKGGGSSSERRARRVRFIAGVLKNLDFDVEVKGDWLLAKLKKYECGDIEEKLDFVGRLMCCARQLDMVMYSDGVVDWYVKAFMQGNYAFEKRPLAEKKDFSS